MLGTLKFKIDTLYKCCSIDIDFFNEVLEEVHAKNLDMEEPHLFEWNEDAYSFTLEQLFERQPLIISENDREVLQKFGLLDETFMESLLDYVQDELCEYFEDKLLLGT